MVSEHTHSSPNGRQSTIDLVFLSNPHQLIHCRTLPPLASSDHACIDVLLSSRIDTEDHSKIPRKVWLYDRADFELANELLVGCGDIINPDDDLEHVWSVWEEYFMSIMHQCIPQVTVKVKKNPPWLSSVLLTNIRKKNSLYRRARKSGRFEDVGNYKKQRNLVANMLKSSKAKFFDRLNPSDPKSFWKTVKTLSKQSISIPALKDKCGHVASSDVDKAVMLNDFFVQCFNYSVPALDNWSSQDYDLDSSSCPDEFYCSEDEVIDLLTSLNLTKASGSDGISATMLRNTACSIAPAIVMLFNMSISTGKLPSAWKLSAIVPIPKSGDNTNVSNYRPISLLPILSKLLEKHMYAIILHQFEEFSPISVRQWGFQHKKSTTAALLKTFNDWALALDNHKEVCAVFFDIRKAFDSDIFCRS